MKEQEKQERFFSNALVRKKDENNAINLYKDLVFHRFNEVLTNANPILKETISKKRFEKLIEEFMQSGAKTDLIWQLPNEFRSFIKPKKDLEKELPFINDLLWFEWIEVKLIMNNYKDFKKDDFNLKSSYKLSKGARIKRLSFKVFEKDFKTKGEYFLIAYYDLEKLEVIYREISSFMYQFLKKISKMSVNNALKEEAKKHKINKKELSEILIEPLKELCSLGVLVKKDK